MLNTRDRAGGELQRHDLKPHRVRCCRELKRDAVNATRPLLTRTRSKILVSRACPPASTGEGVRTKIGVPAAGDGYPTALTRLELRRPVP
jgi:hypothetical protein